METPVGAAVAVTDEVRAEAERLAAGTGFPAAYVARVKAAAGRLAVTEGGCVLVVFDSMVLEYHEFI